MAYASWPMAPPKNAESPDKIRNIPVKVRERFMQAKSVGMFKIGELEETIQQGRHLPTGLRLNEGKGQLEWTKTKIVTQRDINRHILATNFKNPNLQLLAGINAGEKNTGSNRMSLIDLPRACWVEVDVKAQVAVWNETRKNASACGNNDLAHQLQLQTKQFQTLARGVECLVGRVVAVYRETQEFQVQFVLDTPNATPRLLAAPPATPELATSESTPPPKVPEAPSAEGCGEPIYAAIATTLLESAAAASPASSSSKKPTSAANQATNHHAATPSYRVAASVVTEVSFRYRLPTTVS